MSDLTPAVLKLSSCPNVRPDPGYDPGCAARATSIAVKYAALASLCLAVPNPKK